MPTARSATPLLLIADHCAWRSVSTLASEARPDSDFRWLRKALSIWSNWSNFWRKSSERTDSMN